MSDEQQGTEAQGQETTPNQDFRNSQLAQQTFAQMKQLQDELAAMKQAEAEKKQAEEQKQLEAKGQYEEALAKLTADMKSMKEAHAKELLNRDVTAELLKAGASNDMFIRGVVGSYDGDVSGIAEFVTNLKADESNASFFATGEAAPNPGIKAPTTGPPAAKNNGMSEEELLAAGDPDTMKAVFLREMGQEQ